LRGSFWRDKMQWKTDDVAMEICSSIDSKARLTEVRVGQIDKSASRHNGARREPYHADLVAEYAAAMRRGDMFPCIVLAQIDNATKLVVAGGNHRFAAAQSLGCESVQAIVLKCTQAEFRLLSKRLNTTNGLRETTEDRAEGAADLVIHANFKQADAAAAMGVAKATVQAVLTKRKIEELAADCNRDITITSGLAGEFGGLVADQDITSELLDYIACKPSVTEARLVGKDVRAATSAAGRKEVLRLAAEVLAAQKRKPKQPRLQTRANVTRGVRTLENNIIGARTLCRLQMSQAEALEMATKLELIVRHLREVAQ
jgi:ParB-like chromosome segregation protein Spo0J